MGGVILSMLFENTLILLFGLKKGYQTASHESNSRERRIWLRQAAKSLLNKIDSLDTTIEHKRRLADELEEIYQLLSKGSVPSWELIYRFFRLVAMLLGMGGIVHYSPIYLPYYENSADPIESFRINSDTFSIKQEVAERLLAEGKNIYKISRVLNISEYEAKKLLSVHLKGRTKMEKKKRVISAKLKRA
jgi:hypothetical protein